MNGMDKWVFPSVSRLLLFHIWTFYIFLILQVQLKGYNECSVNCYVSNGVGKISLVGQMIMPLSSRYWHVSNHITVNFGCIMWDILFSQAMFFFIMQWVDHYSFVAHTTVYSSKTFIMKHFFYFVISPWYSICWGALTVLALIIRDVIH